MAEILLDGIGHQYGDDPHALRSVDLTWEHGGAYALLGPSGCGKTTMLNIISGLVVPTQGRVLFDGLDVTDLPTADRNIAQVFQFPVLYDTMTVEQNLTFPLRNRGFDRDDARRRAGEISELLEIDHLRSAKAKGLAADAKQLVSLGRALVRTEVSAILLDEPLTVIDPQQKWGIRQALKRVHAELNHTLVYVTHDQTEALTFADEVVVMTDGVVVQKGTPDDLFERPNHRFVGNFIGSPGMNFLPVATAPAAEAGTAVTIGGEPWIILPRSVAAAHDIDADHHGPVAPDVLCVGVRPEFVSCSGSPVERGIGGVIRRRSDLGTAVIADIETAIGTVVAKTPRLALAEGDRCWVAPEPDHLLLFAHDEVVTGAERAMAAGCQR